MHVELSEFTDTFSIFAPQALVISNDTAVCADGEGFYLDTNLPGGEWSGNGVEPDGWFVPSESNVGENVLGLFIR